ncbi:uncharacterized protein [Acropora muricata]|uniref:uncharacterized protein n=1 Tax=Acropora muricata TaxID=159855 RepID=UPI0034E536C9
MVEKGEYRLDVMWEIDFDALENPTWRSQEGLSCDQGDVKKPVKEMISDIMTFDKRWEEEENNYDQKMVKEVKDKFFPEFITHVNKEEEQGVSTIEGNHQCPSTRACLDAFSFYPRTRNYGRDPFNQNSNRSDREKRTTSKVLDRNFRKFWLNGSRPINLEKAYKYLRRKVNDEEMGRDYGLLEVSLLQDTHRIILKDLPLPTKGSSKPGKLSSARKITEFKGEFYEYQFPEDMTNAVNKLLDKYNFLFDKCTQNGLNAYEDYYNLFRLCAWLLFELLDLHPFSDGNGRLCRILGSYLLSFFTPFPTPIYNVWTQSNKDDYKQALVDARKSKTRHPCALASMIIECSYHGWKNFIGELDEMRNVENGTQEKSLNSTTEEN